MCRREVKQAGREGCVVDAGDGGRRRGKGKADLSTCCHFPSLMVEMMVSTEDLLLKSHNTDNKKME